MSHENFEHTNRFVMVKLARRSGLRSTVGHLLEELCLGETMLSVAITPDFFLSQNISFSHIEMTTLSIHCLPMFSLIICLLITLSSSSVYSNGLDYPKVIKVLFVGFFFSD